MLESIRGWGSTAFASLKVRNFRLYTIGQLISGTGTWMQSVSLSFLVLYMTKSASDLGIVTGAQFLPMLFFGIQAGVFVDRLNKRRLIFITQGSFLLVALAMFAFIEAGWMNLAWIVAFSLMLGAINALDNPARQAFVQQLVGRDHLQNAVSLNSANFNLARALGPAAVGVIIAAFGISWGFLLNSISYLAVLVALKMMSTGELFPARPVPREPGQVRQGLSYVRERPILLVSLAAVFVAGVFAFNFQVTIPVLATVTYRGGAARLGDFMSLFGLGAIGGALFSASLKRPATVRNLALTSTLFAAALLSVGAIHVLGMAEVSLVVLGAMSIAFNALINTTLQLNSEFAMRGRVMALFTFGLLGSTPIGAPIIGLVVARFSPSWGFIVGAAALAVAALLFGSLALRERPSRREAPNYT